MVINRMSVALKQLTIRAERSTPNIKINVVNLVLTVANHNVVECDNSYEYAYTISNSTQPSVTVNILNQPIKMIVDSEASCNIIGETTTNKLVKFGAKLVQHETKIFPYGSPPLISS